MAYGALAAAICAWVAVGYFAVIIQNERAAYLQQISDTATQVDKAAADARLHVFASGNLARSSALDAIVAPDVSSIIDTIRSVGTAAGVPIKINDALPGTVAKTQKDIHAVAFVIESSGSFSKMMHVLALFGALPLPSSIEMVDLARVPQDAAVTTRTPQVWHLNLKMRVLTTAIVSS